MYSRQGANPNPPSPAEIMSAYDKGTISYSYAANLLTNIHGYTGQMVYDALGPRVQPPGGTDPTQNGNGNGVGTGMPNIPDNLFAFMMLMLGLK